MEEQVRVDLMSGDMTEPRYTIHIVNSARPMSNRYAVFIVPLGRESEWLFSCDAGRRELANHAAHQRLAIVTLNRHHTYDSMDSVKDELSTKVLELAPPGLGKAQVPFQSLGDDINMSELRHRGHSDINGECIVEDVDVEDDRFRRLIFTSTPHIIQSEARLIKVSTGKGKKKKSSSTQDIDANYLSMDYHFPLIAGLALLENFHKTMEGGARLLLVGLGGGSLSLFIHNILPKVHQEVIEIDATVVDIAKQWFGFLEDDRLKVTLGDGLKVIQDKVKDGEQYDVVIIDVDSKDPTVGMSGPPQEFVSAELTQTLSQLLYSRGVLMYNLVCRNKELRTEVLDQLKSTFKEVYIKKVIHDINECVYCLPKHRDTSLKEAFRQNNLPKTVNSAIKVLQQVVKMAGCMKARDFPDQLSFMLHNLTVV